MTAATAAPVLIRFGRVGDMVLQTPLLHLLHCRFGKPCRLITSGPWSRDLFEGNEDVGDVMQLRRRHALRWLDPEHWRLISYLRTCTGPIYVSEDAPRQLSKIRWLLRTAGVPIDRCLFLTDQHIESRHWIDRLIQFGGMTPAAFSGDAEVASPFDIWTAPRLTLRDVDRIDAAAWLRTRELEARKFVVVQVGNKRAMKWGRARSEDNKSWPNSNWIELFQHIRREISDVRILLCGSPNERQMLVTLRDSAQLDRIDIATHDLPLRRLAAILELAHSMVSVDSGPSHIATAVGCPTLVIYGSESRHVWGRRSPFESIVVELGGGPTFLSAREVSPTAAITAWRTVASIGRFLAPSE